MKIRAIHAADALPVAAFLNANLNQRIPPERWAVLMRPPWGSSGPNHGFMLADDSGRIAGVYLAVYSSRGTVSICNLAPFCVLPQYRAQSLGLLRALLRQRGLVFTDLSPSGNVPVLNQRMGFRHLDTSTRIVLNRPAIVRRFELSDQEDDLASTLVGVEAQRYLDHCSAPAAGHLLVRSSTSHAYLMYRVDRRRRLPVFASPLYVGGDHEVLAAAWPAVSAHLLSRGTAAVLAERRVLGFTPAGVGRDLGVPRPKMFRGDITADEVDYLYSEMTLLRW